VTEESRSPGSSLPGLFLLSPPKRWLAAYGDARGTRGVDGFVRAFAFGHAAQPGKENQASLKYIIY
jgi:hypothetical protein